MRDFYKTDETMDFGDLPKYWSMLDTVYKRVTSLPDSRTMTTSLTARRFDESQTAGVRVYFEATRLLQVTIDNHRALLDMFEHGEGVSLWAPWSLLRPQFECAIIASWILDPDDGLERRRRGLRCEVLDSIQQRRHIECFKDVPELRSKIVDLVEARKQKTETTYKREAAELGMNWDRVVQTLNVVDIIPRLSWVREVHEPIYAPMFISTWRMLSGFEHGLGWAMMHGTDRTAETKIPGGAEVSASISDEPFELAGKLTVAAMIKALTRLERLHTAPTPGGPVRRP